MSADRQTRAAQRKPLNIPAWASFEQHEPVPCHVVEIGPQGARIAFADAAQPFPDDFTLWFSRSGHPRRFCRVTEREDCQLDVKFVVPGRPDVRKRNDATSLDC
jgi:hypothetical protein